jgi:hypothetical protein
MATNRRLRGQNPHVRGEVVIFAPRDYGRVAKPDGTQQWWVRGPNGNWLLLTHQRVTEHEDGTITVAAAR